MRDTFLEKTKTTSRKDYLLDRLNSRVGDIVTMMGEKDYSKMISCMADSIIYANELADIKADEKGE